VKDRKRSLLAVMLFLVLALSLAGFVSAKGISTSAVVPHNFYGGVTVGGSPAAVGTEIEARGAGVLTGIDGNPLVTTAEGQYGGSGSLDDKLVVQGDVAGGAPIAFYVDGVQAQCRQAGATTWLDSYPFDSGAMTELDLRVEEALPTATPVPPTATPTATPVPPTATPTDTPVLPTATPTNTATPTGAPSASLGVGWNLFSVPVSLDADSDSVTQIFGASVSDIDLLYRWDAENTQWLLLDGSYELSPLEALYVKMTASATVDIVPDAGMTGLPARQLYAGSNLIGPAPAYDGSGFPATAVEIALASIKEAGGGLTGYTMVVSPALNQPGWAYAPGAGSQDMLAYKGYWVVMENDDTLYGFSTTPLAP